MGKLIKIVALVFILFSFFSCKNTQNLSNSWYNAGNDGTSQYLFNMRVSEYQIDSVCAADGLARNTNKWIKNTYTDYETGDTVSKYIYIKSMENHEECIYVISAYKDSTIMSKRIRR